MLFSILTLYNLDPTIFDGFRVPEALDKQTTIDQLCLDLAEISLVYPSPMTMKSAIRIWTDIHFKEWQDLQDTLEYEYNPIWNVDGTEVEERNLNSNHTKTGTDTVNASGKDSVENSGSDTVANSGTDTTTRTGNVTNVREVVGYNESNYSPAEKNTETYNNVADATVHGLEQETTYGGKNETTYGRQDQTTYNTTDDIDDTGTITRTRQGNIGVTKTQDLIQSQRDIVQFNVTDFIIRQFKRKFCVMVY